MPKARHHASCAAAPDCAEPLATDDPFWCHWHSGLLYDHRKIVDAPHPGNDFFHARDRQDCPACTLGVDPRQGLCRAPACEERAAFDAVDDEYASWCGRHADLLLDHRLDQVEGSDNHFHPADRAACRACNRWIAQ